jgi:hypothetical protein
MTGNERMPPMTNIAAPFMSSRHHQPHCSTNQQHGRNRQPGNVPFSSRGGDERPAPTSLTTSRAWLVTQIPSTGQPHQSALKQSPILNVAVRRRWATRHVNFSSSFVQADLKEEVYVELPLCSPMNRTMQWICLEARQISLWTHPSTSLLVSPSPKGSQEARFQAVQQS